MDTKLLISFHNISWMKGKILMIEKQQKGLLGILLEDFVLGSPMISLKISIFVKTQFF
jgi:hypothetical protein